MRKIYLILPVSLAIFLFAGFILLSAPQLHAQTATDTTDATVVPADTATTPVDATVSAPASDTSATVSADTTTTDTQSSLETTTSEADATATDSLTTPPSDTSGTPADPSLPPAELQTTESVGTPTDSAGGEIGTAASTEPALTTDKADYAPGETATIFGNFFNSLQNVSLTIIGNTVDGSTPVTSSWNVTADNVGSFTTLYTLPGTYIPLYLLAANSSTGELLAQTSFTDTSLGITSILPTSGTTAGGTSVTVTGTGFASGQAPFTLIFDTSSVTATRVDNTHLTATTPAHAAGIVNVTVTDKSASAATLTNGYDYTTAQAGHIIIQKDAMPDSSQLFAFTDNFGNGNSATFNLVDDATPGLPSFNAEVIPGSGFSVSETVPSGWKQYSATCDGTGNTPSNITVAAGGTVTCTFVNHKLATIVMTKNTTGGNGTFSFTTTGGSNFPSSFDITTSGGTGSQTYNNIDPDLTYSVAESTPLPTGWSLTSSSCSGTNTPGHITPNNGETITCTFVNTFAKLNQTISVTTPAPASAKYNSTFGVAATASSGLSVAITTSGVCSGSGTGSATITMTGGTGTCTVHYNQSGNGSYNAAPEVTETVTADKADATIDVDGYTGKYDGDAHGATGAATGVRDEDLSSLLHLGSSFTNVPGGTADWSFDGDSNYKSDSGRVDIVIDKADANCSSIAGYSGVYDGDAHGATGSCVGVEEEILTGLNLGDSFANVPGGTADWIFTDVTGNYKDDSGSVNIDISKADANITVTPYDVTYNGDAHTATYTAKGVKGEDLTGMDVGGTTHTNANFYKDDSWTFTDSTGNYNDASGKVDDNIGKADAVCTITGYTGIYDGHSHGATGSCVGVKEETLTGLNLGDSFANVPGGNAHWVFTDGTGNYNNQSGDAAIVINKADARCTVTGYAVLYDGHLHTATGSCVGVLAEALDTLNLSGTSHTAGGAYVDSWTFTSSNTNYNNKSGTVNDVIIAAQPPITIANKDFKNGSTIPVKIPSTIPGWTANLYVCANDPSMFCGTSYVAVASGGSNSGTLFRYDSTGQQYIYNLSTKLTSIFKNGTSGNKYSLWITIPSIITGPFKLATITIK